jgi:hypothetical protein
MLGCWDCRDIRFNKQLCNKKTDQGRMFAFSMGLWVWVGPPPWNGWVDATRAQQDNVGHLAGLLQLG